MTLKSTIETSKPIVGMVHLEPLPGAPQGGSDLDAVVDRAVRDASALETGGVDGIMVENFGDAPFYPDDVPKHVVASMTRAAAAVADEISIPLGINVLRNDAEAALSVVQAVDGDYIRVNVHTGARITDQGVIEGIAHETLRLRDRLDTDVDLFADVDVKHSAPLAGRSIRAESFVDQTERGLADVAVVSGSGTGTPIDMDHLREVAFTREEHGLDTPIVAGSGVRETNVEEVLSIADGAIVGTALKEDGETTKPVDVDRVTVFMDLVDDLR